MSFAVSDPVGGTLTVYIRQGILDSMSLAPTNQITKDEIIKILGSDYLVMRYALDDCLNKGGAAPRYETPKGPFESLEYRRRGLAVDIHENEVDTINFVSKRSIPAHSRCTASKSKRSTS